MTAETLSRGLYTDISTLGDELEDEFVSVECQDIIVSIDESIDYLESAAE